jgi:hypothetical protein
MNAQWIGWLQWPAMVITVAATYLVASETAWKRNASFWCYLASNLLWIVWGIKDGAVALIILQVVLAALNIRGVLKTDR